MQIFLFDILLTIPADISRLCYDDGGREQSKRKYFHAIKGGARGELGGATLIVGC